MRYAYYPGCSLGSTAREYDLSLKAVCARIGVQLDEIEGWSCCGASSGHATDRVLSVALPARDLAMGRKLDADVATACPACYLRLRAALHEAGEDMQLRRDVEGAVGAPLDTTRGVRHLLDIVCNVVGLDEVRRRVRRPLDGMRLVAYYGCYLVRPPAVAGFDDAENPVCLDSLLKALGADIRDWSGKVDCCGGSLSLVKRDTVVRLVGGLLEAARQVDADGIVTACPLCQSNLDTRQKALPVFYFTELMGLAMGAPDAGNWFRRHIINPVPALKRCNLLD
jgi:heterodisulfide reductase subunit B